jgi:periplasmic divalent cation tolerance protein
VGEPREEDGFVVEITTTVATEDEAVRLARRLVAEGLVACASLRSIRSLYRWQGSLCDEPEVELTLKTDPSRAVQMAERLRALHPYETPAILLTSVASVNPDYSAWLAANTRQIPES